MYKHVLLAYDGSLEGRTALREGALLARQCGAQVFLLAVLVDTGIALLADVAHAGAFVQMENAVMESPTVPSRFSPEAPYVGIITSRAVQHDRF